MALSQTTFITEYAPYYLPKSTCVVLFSPQPDEDLFNPDYIEVDRVLEIAITTDTETGEVRRSSNRLLKTNLL